MSKAFRKIALHLHPDTTIRKLNAGEITKEKATENGEYLKLLTKGVALINGNAGPMQIPDKNDYAKWKAQKDAGANVADLHDAKKEGYFVEYYGRCMCIFTINQTHKKFSLPKTACRKTNSKHEN